jgi:c(7)-type cytochrome triheme protein
MKRNLAILLTVMTALVAEVSSSHAQAQEKKAGAPKPAAPGERVWAPLAKDGIHDPRNPGLKQKQEPADALSRLVPDTAGNLVRWVEALEKGQINPRAALNSGTQVRIRDDFILLNQRGGTPMVRFPHRQHTLWLDCTNCHDKPFLPKTGANKLSMMMILQGEQCGICHGAVAFPLTECSRCHNTPRPTERKAP